MSDIPDDWLLRQFYEASKSIIEDGRYLTGPLELDEAEVKRVHEAAAKTLGQPVAVNLRERIAYLERALMAERKKALEEAAKVADATAAQEARMSISYFDDGDRRSASLKSTAAFTAQDVAAAIRKLGEEPSHYPVLKPHLRPDSFTEEELKAAIQKVTRKGED